MRNTCVPVGGQTFSLGLTTGKSLSAESVPVLVTCSICCCQRNERNAFDLLLLLVPTPKISLSLAPPAPFPRTWIRSPSLSIASLLSGPPLPFYPRPATRQIFSLPLLLSLEPPRSVCLRPIEEGRPAQQIPPGQVRALELVSNALPFHSSPRPPQAIPLQPSHPHTLASCHPTILAPTQPLYLCTSFRLCPPYSRIYTAYILTSTNPQIYFSPSPLFSPSVNCAPA